LISAKPFWNPHSGLYSGYNTKMLKKSTPKSQPEKSTS
jgi:hypothetical protein